MKDLFDENGFSYIFSNINKEFTKLINQKLNSYGVTRSEAPLLLSICQHKQVIQENLAKEFDLNEATITRIIKRLEDKGLIKRVSDNEDKRKKIVLLTDKGIEISEIIFKKQVVLCEKIFDDFSDDELDTLIMLSKKLLSNLRD